jgi:outer membrane murein-binding lipoprotein Lpp
VKRLPTLIAAMTLGATVLTGCGGGTDAYCDTLESASEEIAALDQGDFDGFEEVVESTRELADTAPDEVAEEWNVLVGALDGFVEALSDAGIELSDLAAIQGGSIPEGVDQEKLTEAFAKIQELNGEDVSDANDKIEAHAKSECGIDLEGL